VENIPYPEITPLAFCKANQELVAALVAVAKSDPAIKKGSDSVNFDRFVTNPEITELQEIIREFNLFSALGVTQKEIRHSRVLGWLFSPDGSHEQGDLYLKRFLALVLKEKMSPMRDRALPADGWQVTVEDDRIDVLISCPKAKFLCAVENKIHAGQSPNQLAGYKAKLAERYPAFERHHVFLTLLQDAPADPDWLSVSFGEVVSTLLADATSPHPEGTSAGVLLHHYAEWIRDAATPKASVNIFTVLSLNRHELRHSDLLAWLLNPQESHGSGDRFLRGFLRLLWQRNCTTLPDKAWELDWSDMQVRREFAHIDVLLLSERHQVAIIVENKLYARERDRQMSDYRRFVERFIASTHLTTVYLDLKGGSTSDSKAVNLDYQALLPLVEELASGFKVPPPEMATSAILSEYSALLGRQLWLRNEPPPVIRSLATRVVRSHPSTVALLRASMKTWALELGQFLHARAKEIFRAEIAPVSRVWFSFVPEEFTKIPLLADAGADEAFQGQLVFYQFFMTPFADDISVRPPQVAIDVKMTKAKPRLEPLKEHLHDMAKASGVFNRAEGARPTGFNHLLNFELCSLQEIATCTEEELRARLTRRLSRFHSTIHAEIVSFFKASLKTYKSHQ
jgi:hypothetical protein